MAEKIKSNISPSSPVSVLSGVGPTRAAAYAKSGVTTLLELLYHVPRAYENRGDIRPLSESYTGGGKSALVLTIATEPRAAKLRGRMTVVKLRAFDESGTCELTFFNQPYLKQTFTVGSEWRFYGVVEQKATRSGVRYYMTSPAFEPWREGALPDFCAVYPLSEGLTQKQVAQNAAEAIRYCLPTLSDHLPDEIRTARGLCTLAFAIRNIHSPESYTALAAAKRRLIFDELFFFSLGLAMQNKHEKKRGAFPCKKQNISPMLPLLGYELTGAQKRVISEIAADMRTDVPMSRIVVGDVGCGKTAVAAAAMYIAALNGRQSALMAPTEILARQHYEDLAPLFEKLGVKCALLVGATTVAEKRRVRAALVSEGEDRCDIVIGTHALISSGVEFSALSLVVTDEQHRFGVAQRATLAEKAQNVHVLAMSATPIPRSLALAVYGDLDISKIDEMPAGRQRVDTFTVDESYRTRLNAFIEKTVGEGGQVYVVCPAIEENATPSGEVELSDIGMDGIEQKPPLKAATVYAEELSEALPSVSVALVHGKMKAAEKEAVMTTFSAGDIDVLVSTTVIEVGVNVPNASLMIVENAERFGLSQLHQLRGRVGRGARKSYCILVSDTHSPTSRKRLDTMRDNYDGFSIAEVDLEARGPGDFFGKDGVRQSGGVRFRFADLCGDASLLAAATESAHALLAADPALDGHTELKKIMTEMLSVSD
ncbi:MAG: ATP-dependent DNA helicase RecG [Clostridia bacterium]|nr:ATP-dependent DNA helicase RecG [Clostridia bacterium]